VCNLTWVAVVMEIKMKPKYYIYNCVKQFIKIGIAFNVAGRLKALQSGCPYQLEIVGIKEGNFPIETRLHKAFEKHRISNEWYSNNEKVVAAIEVILKENFCWDWIEHLGL
jgi:hypothetical protein